MRLLLLIFYFAFINVLLSQEVVTTQFIDSISMNADKFVGVDDFENYYYTKGNTFYKKTDKTIYSYTNTQLGELTSVDITNPLKILLFYRDFNTIVLLDNRLNELTDIINFSRENFTKNITFAGISSNNNLWLYSLDDNVLSLWNYETKKTIFDSQPLSFYSFNFEANNLISDYENCWVSSEKEIVKFNEFGSYLTTITLPKSSSVQLLDDDLTYFEGEDLFVFKNNSMIKVKLVNNKHLSTNYFVNKNNLYFFKDGVIYKYSILKK